jgi:hypothetical protein
MMNQVGWAGGSSPLNAQALTEAGRPSSPPTPGVRARRLLRLTLIASTLTLCAASCDVLSPRACTQIGCNDGFTVALEGSLPASYTVTISYDGGDPFVRHCSPTQPCQRVVFGADVIAQVVTVRVEGSDLDLTREVTPKYEILQPNGSDCPPTCQRAEVTVSVP